MTLCAPVAGGWQVQAPEPVGDPGTLFARLRARAGGLPVAFGIDCPIGVPRGYAALCGGGYADFPAFLRGLADRPAFFRVAAGLGEVSAEAPFYPARGVRGMTRLAHARALGLADAAALNRACDRATADRPAGAPVFWTLGANQSGKAALAAWRDVLIPGLAAGAVRLWPFEGAFLGLLAPGEVAVAETYPDREQAAAGRSGGLRGGDSGGDGGVGGGGERGFAGGVGGWVWRRRGRGGPF